MLLATPVTWAPWVLHSKDQHLIPLSSVSILVPSSDIWPHLSSRMAYKVEIIDRSHLGLISVQFVPLAHELSQVSREFS